MKPEQLAHDFMTNQTGQEGGQVIIDWYAFRNALSCALLEAEQRGRRQGMEEAAKVAEEYGDGGLEYDIEPEATVATAATSRMITDAIRSKIEVQK